MIKKIIAFFLVLFFLATVLPAATGLYEKQGTPINKMTKKEKRTNTIIVGLFVTAMVVVTILAAHNCKPTRGINDKKVFTGNLRFKNQ